MINFLNIFRFVISVYHVLINYYCNVALSLFRMKTGSLQIENYNLCKSQNLKKTVGLGPFLKSCVTLYVHVSVDMHALTHACMHAQIYA